MYKYMHISSWVLCNVCCLIMFAHEVDFSCICMVVVGLVLGTSHSSSVPNTAIVGFTTAWSMISLHKRLVALLKKSRLFH